MRLFPTGARKLFIADTSTVEMEERYANPRLPRILHTRVLVATSGRKLRRDNPLSLKLSQNSFKPLK
jgi:hypothetical protein